MRLLRSLLWCVTLGGLGFVALLFLVQNLHTERIVFFGLTVTLNFALVVAGAVAVGFLLALLLIVPGRIATALYSRSLDRELRQLERQVAQLAEQRERLMDGREHLLQRYERLFADRDRVIADRDKVIAERERLRAQLATAIATAAATAQAMTKPDAAERVPAAAAAVPARQPLALRERERGAENEARPAPVRIAPAAVDERRPASVPASASAHVRADASAVESAPATASASASASASAPGGRILPPIPAVPDPPAAHLAPMATDPPAAAMPPAVPDPPALTSTAALAEAASAQDDAVEVPPTEARPSHVRERVARHTAAAREQLGQWRGQAGRVRRSAGARYNEMRTTLFARARAVAGSVRQLPTPSAAAQRDTAPPESRAPSTSPAVPSRDEDGHESNSMLKGELPVWRPPE